MNSWDELTILHNRLRTPNIQAALTYDEIVEELLQAILPIQEGELIDKLKSVSTDRNHGGIRTSMGAYGKPVIKLVRSKERGVSDDICYNCGNTGHRSYNCEETMCNWCDTAWSSIKSKGYHHNSECPQKGKAANKRGGGFVNRQQLLCSNCQGAGHIRIDCIKPICSACGTIWRTKQNPGYHHCDQCPHPSKQGSNFGKRSNPYLTPESRAHMSMMKQCLIEEEQEEIEHPIDASDWSDEDLGDEQKWKRPHL